MSSFLRKHPWILYSWSFQRSFCRSPLLRCKRIQIRVRYQTWQHRRRHSPSNLHCILSFGLSNRPIAIQRNSRGSCSWSSWVLQEHQWLRKPSMIHIDPSSWRGSLFHSSNRRHWGRQQLQPPTSLIPHSILWGCRCSRDRWPWTLRWWCPWIRWSRGCRSNQAIHMITRWPSNSHRRRKDDMIPLSMRHTFCCSCASSRCISHTLEWESTHSMRIHSIKELKSRCSSCTRRRPIRRSFR